MPCPNLVVRLCSAVILMIGFLQSAGAQIFTSDELPPVICPLNTFVTGVTCNGSRCDNVGITCSRMGGTTWATAPRTRPFFSEENGGRSKCLPGQAIVGLACKGGNCDNVSLMCARTAGVNFISCGETHAVSEENGTLRLPTGEVAVGMRCIGRQCDDKTLISCGSGSFTPSRIEDAPPGHTVRYNMHACPSGHVVTGVHADRNILLCFGPTNSPLLLDQTDPKFKPLPFAVPGESPIQRCHPGNVITGVHAGRNSFTCMAATGPLGPPTVDRTTVDRNMHACPSGSVLVGVDFRTNRFLCSTFAG